jgi:hypothetical protein
MEFHPNVAGWLEIIGAASTGELAAWSTQTFSIIAAEDEVELIYDILS